MTSNLRGFLRRRFSREGAVGLSLTLGFLASAGLMLLFGILSRDVLSVGGSAALDRKIALAVHDLETPARDRLVAALTILGSHWFLIPASLAVVAVLVLRRCRVSAVLFTGSVAGGFLLESLFKITFHRARPNLWPALVTEETYSFPSGHATMATVFFAGLTAVVFHTTRRRAVRAAALAVAAPVILGVASSRVYLGAHWATDVLAGILVGLFWVVLSATGAEFFARPRDSRKANQRR